MRGLYSIDENKFYNSLIFNGLEIYDKKMFKINVPASNVSSNLNTTGAGGFVLLISVNFLYSSAALTALTDSSTLTCISWQCMDAWLQDFCTSCSINFHLSIISIIKCGIFDLKFLDAKMST